MITSRIRKIIILLILAFIFQNCTTNKHVIHVYKSELLKIKQISENVYMHISYIQTNDFGNVGCNGMVYINEDDAIVFDTPTNDAASVELINWIEKKQAKEIKAVVATHFHSDCLGGLNQFHDNGSNSYSTNTTIKLAEGNNVKILPEIGFDNQMEIEIGKETVLLKFFGEGHTVDNIVGFIPNEQVLFGGCLIKSLQAGKGNLEDANVAEWPETVQKIKNEITDINVVIPGHGKAGGKELLNYTIQLFDK